MFQISHQPDWQMDSGIFNSPTMVHSQILVHSWGVQNKDFGAVSQTDLKRCLVPSVTQTKFSESEP